MKIIENFTESIIMSIEEVQRHDFKTLEECHELIPQRDSDNCENREDWEDWEESHIEKFHIYTNLNINGIFSITNDGLDSRMLNMKRTWYKCQLKEFGEIKVLFRDADIAITMNFEKIILGIHVANDLSKIELHDEVIDSG